MRKTIILTLAVLIFHHTLKAEGITYFNGNFAEAKAEAKKENKFLVIDCQTSWCGWCKYMEKNLYPVKEVADFYNSHFVFLVMDMEHGEGKNIARQYKINEYPSFLFFNSNGDFVHFFIGASKQPQDFIAVGKTAIDSMHNCMGLAHRFLTGEKDTAFLKEMIKTISYYADPKLIENALAMYWSQMPVNRVLEKDNWDLFKYYEMDVSSGAFDYFYQHKALFTQIYKTKDDSNCFYIKAALYVKTAAENKDGKNLKKAKDIAFLSGDRQIWFTVCSDEIPYYAQKDSFDQFYADVDRFEKKFGDDWIGNIAASMENSDTKDPKFLEMALTYSKQALAIDKSYYNMDTYARLLYRLGKYDDAYASANEAMALTGQIQNPDEKTRDSSATGALLEQIKKSISAKN